MRHRDVVHPADPWITHPRRFGPPPVAVRSTKFLTVRNLITPTPTRSYDCVSVNSLQCGQARPRPPQSSGLDKVGAVPNRPVAARSAPRSDPPAATAAFCLLHSSFCLLHFPTHAPRNCGD